MERRTILRSLTGMAALTTVAAAQECAVTSVPALDCYTMKRGPRDGYFPDLLLTTHEGERARFYSDLVRGRVVVFNFFYTRCDDRCPMYTMNLAAVQTLLGNRVGKDIFMYSLTLDPAFDSPRVLRAYIDEHGVGPGWTFLTGRPDDLELLRRRLGFVDPDPVRDKDRTNHIGMIRYGNERIDRWSACPAMTRAAEIVRYLSWMFPAVTFPEVDGGKTEGRKG